jgi:hypothetical protein
LERHDFGSAAIVQIIRCAVCQPLLATRFSPEVELHDDSTARNTFVRFEFLVLAMQNQMLKFVEGFAMRFGRRRPLALYLLVNRDAPLRQRTSFSFYQDGNGL